MILSVASTVYGAAATWRRRWYARDPSRRRRLDRPVISVGNLRVGRQRQDAGRRAHRARCSPRAASGRRSSRAATDGRRRRTASRSSPTARRVLAPLEHAGDEPLMLARALPGVPVLVAADRYCRGRVAERTLGATVHLLDDGFQHLGLARDVDLLVACARTICSDRVLPAGRLREPLTAAAAADALLVDGSSPAGDRPRSRERSASARRSRSSAGSAGRAGFTPERRRRSAAGDVDRRASPASRAPSASSPISRRRGWRSRATLRVPRSSSVSPTPTSSASRATAPRAPAPRSS